ncbi:MAG: nuclear transport factor 2 family protein [Kofleriaceae bacterium]|nr:nuclear transport factor 2 family protein [Kofleriaceae bacterium]
MTTLEVGKKLVELCNNGKNAEAMSTLYDPNIVSVEPVGSSAGQEPGTSQQVQGIDAVREKSRWWIEHHTVHSEKAEGPFPHGDRFAVKFTFDVTDKDSNQRMTIEETALYTVKNDKIVREEFFYAT